jgi:hypothetical protein
MAFVQEWVFGNHVRPISFVGHISSNTLAEPLYWLSIGVFVLGLASFVLFVASEDASSTGSLLLYAGLWQRLFLLNHCTYLGVISAIMTRSAQRSV